MISEGWGPSAQSGEASGRVFGQQANRAAGAASYLMPLGAFPSFPSILQGNSTEGSMIVHHLRPSRSERVLWLLEEIGVPYTLKVHDREMGRAPPTAREIHPLGKFPMLEDGDTVLAESGAILAYIVARHAPELIPGPKTPEFAAYQQFMHWTEGSLAAWLVMDLIVNGGVVPGVEPGPLPGMLAGEIGNALDWAETMLTGRSFACGESFSAADPMLVWVLGFAESRGHLGERPATRAYLARMRARPAYLRAMARAA